VKPCANTQEGLELAVDMTGQPGSVRIDLAHVPYSIFEELRALDDIDEARSLERPAVMAVRAPVHDLGCPRLPTRYALSTCRSKATLFTTRPTRCPLHRATRSSPGENADRSHDADQRDPVSAEIS
jgi:hypothetical protein